MAASMKTLKETVNEVSMIFAGFYCSYGDISVKTQ